MIRNMYPYKALVAILCISALLLAPLVARAEWSSGELAARAETAEHPVRPPWLVIAPRCSIPPRRTVPCIRSPSAPSSLGIWL